MARLKVTQIRSGIGGKQNQRDTLRTLGVKRIGDTAVHEDKPEVRGMVLFPDNLPDLFKIQEALDEVLGGRAMERIVEYAWHAANGQRRWSHLRLRRMAAVAAVHRRILRNSV